MKTIIILFLLSFSTFSYERIISTVPSLTESLAALGVEKEIIGVSRYCKFSKSICDRPKIGTSIDINYEKIITLKPDAVVLSASTKKDVVKKFKTLKLKPLLFKHEKLDDVMTTLKYMGFMFNKVKESKKLMESIQGEFDKHYLKYPKLKATLVIGSSIKDGEVVSIHVAGSKNFYNDIFRIMGIDNIHSDSNIAYPQLDRERIITTSTDVVFELFEKNNKELIAKSKKAWGKVFVNMKKKPIYIPLVGDYVYIPGPRVSLIARDIDIGLKENNVKSK